MTENNTLPSQSSLNSNDLNDHVKFLIGENKKILQLGSESSKITTLFQNLNCDVITAETIDDFKKLNSNDDLKNKNFEVILIKDFLENQHNPELFLKDLKSSITENGLIICIVPNFTHGSVRLNLLNGDFQYTKSGILNKNTIRFFSLNEILILLNKSGFKITNLNRIKKNVMNSDDFSLNSDILPPDLITAILRDPESETYQYIFSASPSNEIKHEVDWICKYPKNYVLNDLSNRLTTIRKGYEQVQNIKLHNTSLQDHVSSLKLDNASLLDNILKSTNDNTSLKNHILTSTSENASLTNEKKYLEDYNTSLQDHVLKSTNDNTSLKNIILTSTNENASLTNANKYLEDHNTSLQDHVSSLKVEKTSLLDHILTLNNEKTTLQNYLSKSTNDNTSLKNDNASLTNENLSKDSTIKGLQHFIEVYQKIITDIHQSFVFRMLHKFDNTVGKIIPLRPKKYTKSVKQESTISELNITTKKTLESPLKKKDIICFPIINWDFRYQRPQHILTEFAKNGHRVFYFTVNLRPLKKSYELKTLANNIYQIELNSPNFFDIYKDKFNKSIIANLTNQIQILQKDLMLDAVSFVEFPTWGPLVIELRKQFGYPILFDCLDDFTGFGNVIKEREKEESILVSSSDLVLTTSSYLMKKVVNKTKNSLYLPNAGEFEHFNKIKSGLLEYKKPIIGYFGSISDWFDTDLIEHLATNRPQFTFVMIGHTFGADIRKLQELPNIHFLGERPYSELPKYLYDFDVCLIPFKMIPLIEATHPVKIYEYFGAGKPVVATNMPELTPMSDICYLAENKEDFLKKLDLAINEKDDTVVQKRIKFASKNTWEARFKTLYVKLKKLDSFDIENHS